MICRFKGNVKIILNGNEDSPNYPQAAGPSIGQKVLGEYVDGVNILVLSFMIKEVCTVYQ